MRIGIDIRSLMDNQYSGVPEYTYNLLKELLAMDQDNEYVLFYNSFKDIEAKMAEFAFGKADLVASRYPNRFFNLGMQKVLGWPRLDRKLGVDLFFAPNLGFISLSQNAKKVITVHDLSFLRYPDYFSWRRRLWHLAIDVRKQLKRFDAVVAVSQHTKADVVELCGVSPDRVRTIYSGIGDEFKREQGAMEGQAAAIRAKYGLPERFIFSLSTIEPRKNLNSLIEAYGLLLDSGFGRETGLVIAGASGWKQKSIYESWQKSRYKDRIKFIGYVEKSEKRAIYGMADVFAYISFYEGFGFPPLEAIASGCPVVLGADSCLPEIAGKAAILVNPFKISQIAAGIREALTNRELCQKLKERGLAMASGYSWRKTAEEYLSLFKSL